MDFEKDQFFTDPSTNDHHLYVDVDEWDQETTTVSTQWEFESQDIYQDTTDGTIKINSGNSGNVKIDSDWNTNEWIDTSVNPDRQEKLEELAEEQLSKLKRLRDVIIDYISRNNLSRNETEQWKSDLDLIDDHKRRLRDELELSGGPFLSPNDKGLSEDSVLNPSQMEELNEIYKRWT